MTAQRDRTRVSLVVVLPVGPYPLEFVLDTIASIRHYAGPSHAIILVDDSGIRLCTAARQADPGLVVLRTGTGGGTGGGLYNIISLGILHAWRHYDFDVLLKMDTDALFTGPGPERDAIDHFARHPEHGIIGSYRVDCNGHPRDFGPPRARFRRDLSLGSLLLHPWRWKGWRLLRESIRRAEGVGYEVAEHCQGGAYFMSRECVRRLAENRYLLREELRWSGIGEDQIFGLFMYLSGLRHGDLATGDLPLGIRWRGLPMSPADLAARGKKIVHSTRFWEGMREEEIRAFFRDRRARQDLQASRTG